MANELTTTKEYSVQEIAQIGQIFAKSGMYGIKSPEMAMTLMFQAQAEGIHPCKAMQEYHVINGKPSLSSQAMLARFQLAGGTAKWIKRTATEATFYVSHKQGGELEVTWNIDRAKKAGLLGNPTWTKYPEAMLSARCISEAIRAVFPACLGGMYSIEEEEDIAYESAEKKPIDEKTKNFLNGMGGFYQTNEKIYTDTMKSFGYEKAMNIPVEKRDKVFKAIQDKITKAAQHQSAPTAMEQQDSGEVDNSLF